MKAEGFDDNMEYESEDYPKGMPINVSVAIRAKRCSECSRVFFTNNTDFKECRDCKIIF